MLCERCLGKCWNALGEPCKACNGNGYTQCCEGPCGTAQENPTTPLDKGKPNGD